jgi:death-on-curing protein
VSPTSDAAPFYFLTLDVVLKVHREEIRCRGGQTGIRDRDLLISALAQPMMQFGGQFLHENIFEMAAAYAFHIAGNHPFVDGNKRVALAAALLFLGINGYRLREKGTALADMLLDAIEKHRSKKWIAAKLRAMAEKV